MAKANQAANTVKGATEVVAAKGPETITTPAAANKADKARAIFSEMFAQSPVPARKDMIARAVQEAGLTQAGAATYLQNYKTKNNLVKKLAPTA